MDDLDYRNRVNSLGYFIPQCIDLKKSVLNEKYNIVLFKVFDLIPHQKKCRLRSLEISVGDTLYTDNNECTKNFINELYLFDKIDKNNYFFEPVQKDSVTSLKLKSSENDIYIKKAEAKTICDIYYEIIRSFDLKYMHDEEIALTREGLNYYLNLSPYFRKKYSEKEEMRRFKMFESVV